MEEFVNAPKIELSIALKNLDTAALSSPPTTKVRVFYSEDNRNFTFLGETELVIKDYNPDFKKTLEKHYLFEATQYIKVHVEHLVRENTFETLAVCTVSIGQLMVRSGQIAKFKLINPKNQNQGAGSMLIKAKSLQIDPSVAHIQCSGHKLPQNKGLTGKISPYFMIFRNENGEWRGVYESSSLKDCQGEPIWPPFQIALYKLCNNNYKSPLRFEFYHQSKKEKASKKVLGEFETSVSALLAGELSYNLVKPESKEKKFRGTIVFDRFKTEERYSLMDYLKGGLSINMVVGIDFTASNGDPRFPNSLHALRHYNGVQGLNEYQLVIYNVCQTLIKYMKEKQILSLGFGAKPFFPQFYSQKMHNCFPLTGNPAKPYVDGLNGLMQAYFTSLMYVQLYGPTFISSVVAEGMKKATYHKQIADGQYTVMLILTDGEIHDLTRTLGFIEQSSALPISYVVIGVGKERFNNVAQINSHNLQVNQTRPMQMRLRDCSQFLPFREFANQPQNFSRKLLSRIPSQVCEYMAMMGIKPKQQSNVDISQMEEQVGGEEEVIFQAGAQTLSQIDSKEKTSEEPEFNSAIENPTEQDGPQLNVVGGLQPMAGKSSNVSQMQNVPQFQQNPPQQRFPGSVGQSFGQQGGPQQSYSQPYQQQPHSDWQAQQNQHQQQGFYQPQSQYSQQSHPSQLGYAQQQYPQRPQFGQQQQQQHHSNPNQFYQGQQQFVPQSQRGFMTHQPKYNNSQYSPGNTPTQPQNYNINQPPINQHQQQQDTGNYAQSNNQINQQQQQNNQPEQFKVRSQPDSTPTSELQSQNKSLEAQRETQLSFNQSQSPISTNVESTAFSGPQSGDEIASNDLNSNLEEHKHGSEWESKPNRLETANKDTNLNPTVSGESDEKLAENQYPDNDFEPQVFDEMRVSKIKPAGNEEQANNSQPEENSKAIVQQQRLEGVIRRKSDDSIVPTSIAKDL